MSRLLDCYNTLPHGGGAHGGQNVGDQQGEAPPAPVVRVRFLPLLRLLPTAAVTSAAWPRARTASIRCRQCSPQ
eukprot:COSAG04_NODE_18975_length_428_cov_0.522796_1_plen_73_part_10